jgi:hypothetical protein
MTYLLVLLISITLDSTPVKAPRTEGHKLDHGIIN